MKTVHYLKNILLIVLLFLLSGAVLLAKTFFSGFVLPRIDLTTLTIISVIPMIISSYLNIQSEENRLVSFFLAGLTFVVLPFMAGWSVGLPLWKVFAAGTVVYGITNVLYTSMLERNSSGNHAPLAPAINGVLLWLASQCFQGIL